MLKNSLPQDVDVIKVDIPMYATGDTPWEITRQSRQRYYCPVPAQRLSLSDRGPVGYEIRLIPEEIEKGSDIDALLIENKVSITPISIDLTSRTDFEKLQSLLSAD